MMRKHDEKTIWFIMSNGKIGETNYQYKTTIKIPQVVITSAYSEQSGTDAKQIELQGQIEENGQDSFIEVEIITDLEDLHIDNTVGTDDSAYDPDFGQETTETDFFLFYMVGSENPTRHMGFNSPSYLLLKRGISENGIEDEYKYRILW